MVILFIGDIVGKPGRRAARELLPALISKHKADLVIANCENAAAGFGITRDSLKSSRIASCLASGNHIWARRELEL